MPTLIHQPLIADVYYSPLKLIKDERGAVMHHVNYLSPSYKGFQEVYISKTFPKLIKAWKLHLKMRQNFSVPQGAFKFVLYDTRKNSSSEGVFNEFILDDDLNYALLSIPEGVWYGFQCTSEQPGLIVNLSNLLHDSNEVLKLAVEDLTIPYNNWL